jgi:hypothetical protein
MFSALGLVFVGNEGVGSLFHVFRSRTHFRRYRGRRVPFSCFARRTRFRLYRVPRVPFSCFALPDSFSAVPRASGPIFMFCTPGFMFGGTRGVGSRFHVLRSRSRFRRYRGLRVPISCFVLPYSFLAVPRVSGAVFMFSAPGLIFDGTEGVESRFHVLRSQTHFRRYRGCCVPFSCFARPDSFSMVPRASGLIYHVLRSRTRFRLYRGRPFLVFIGASNPVFMFPVPGHVFGHTEGVGSIFHIFFAPGLIFGDTEGVGSRFHVLSARTRFRRYRGRRVPFSCFAHSDSFSMVPRASGPVNRFCAPGLVFGGTGGVRSLFMF